MRPPVRVGDPGPCARSSLGNRIVGLIVDTAPAFPARGPFRVPRHVYRGKVRGPTPKEAPVSDLTPDDITEALAGDDTLPTDESEAVEIRDQDHANRSLRRLGLLDRDQAQVNDAAEAERARLLALIQPHLDDLDEYVDDRMTGIKRARAWNLRGLETWMRATNAAVPTVVTVKLPAGEARLRGNPDRVVITDAASVIGRFPDVEKPVEPSVVVADVKKLTKPSGVEHPVPEGVDVWPGYEYQAAIDSDGAPVPGMFYLVQKVRRFEWDAK